MKLARELLLANYGQVAATSASNDLREADAGSDPSAIDPFR